MMQDKIALVTGAGTGIGQGIALELGMRGAKVLLHYNASAAGALEIVQQIKARGGEAAAAQADLGRVSECQRLVDECVARWGGIDILVNNAGITTTAPILDVTEELWDQTLAVNLKAVFFCSQAAIRVMIPRGGGKIVNIGSVHGQQSAARHAIYAASKGGLHNLTRQMAFELARQHININCVAPGVIEVQRYYDKIAKYNREELAKEVPRGRVGFPEDVAKAAAFLASDEAEFITGQIICVDGGQTLPLPLIRNLRKALDI
jgi:NAD(P)-dependent dehydrogenase (short-subunit alcohol dehydrogenase family)